MNHLFKDIHSFIVCRLSNLYSGHREPCLSQVSLGIKAGYTLDGVPTHRRADNLEMPSTMIQCMSLDQVRKLEYPEETPRGTGRTCKLHTHSGGGNRTPNPR
ncbi:hypothetical protein QTP86_031428, partial [Hemibagrus guttatus]